MHRCTCMTGDTWISPPVPAVVKQHFHNRFERVRRMYFSCEFSARSAHFGQNAGWGESRGARVFLCSNPDDLSATSQHSIFIKFGHETYFGVPSRNPERHFWKFSLSVSFAPKIWNRKSVKQAPYSEQVTGHWCSVKYVWGEIVIAFDVQTVRSQIRPKPV